MYSIIAILSLILCILITTRHHKEKIREFEKAVKWQKTKYKTWRGYLNKGYQIADTSPGANIHPTTIDYLIRGKK